MYHLFKQYLIILLKTAQLGWQYSIFTFLSLYREKGRYFVVVIAFILIALCNIQLPYEVFKRFIYSGFWLFGFATFFLHIWLMEDEYGGVYLKKAYLLDFKGYIAKKNLDLKMEKEYCQFMLKNKLFEWLPRKQKRKKLKVSIL